MRQATPQLKSLAHKLLVQEAKNSPNAGNWAKALEACCQRLHKQLDSLVGTGGFRALFERALYLAKKEHSWLKGMEIQSYPGCELNAPTEATAEIQPKEIRESFTLILANVIWLLVNFIGEDIVFGLMEEAWPDMKIGTPASGSKEGQ
jgi:HPt (histidine-containing phosphotransfer) domain-containing protein